MMSIHTVRRRRRLHPALRRHALPGGPRFGRRPSRPGVLSQWRTADGHRLQRDAGQDSAAVLPGVFSDPAAISPSTTRSCAKNSVPSQPKSATAPAIRARRNRPAEGFVHIAVENMANAIKKIRCSAATTSPVTRSPASARRGPACLPGGGRAGDAAHFHPSLRRRALCLRHGSCRYHCHARTRGRSPARRGADAAPGAAVCRTGRGSARRSAGTGRCGTARTENRYAHLRYEGTDTAIVVDFAAAEDMVRQFEDSYRQRYSFLMPERVLVVEAVSVEAVGVSAADITTRLHDNGAVPDSNARGRALVKVNEIALRELLVHEARGDHRGRDALRSRVDPHRRICRDLLRNQVVAREVSNDCRTLPVGCPSSFGPAWITPIRYFTYPETGRFPGLSIGPRTR